LSWNRNLEAGPTRLNFERRQSDNLRLPILIYKLSHL
jgi:hypothetical protein